VKVEVDTGYTGLARDFPHQVSAPPRKPAKDAGPGERNYRTNVQNLTAAPWTSPWLPESYGQHF
jgi:hypothetical protein